MTGIPKYYILKEVAVILRRSPKTVLNMAYTHHLDRYTEIVGFGHRRRVFTPQQVKFLHSCLKPVKHFPASRK